LKFYRFGFMGKPEGNRPLRPHEVRDGDVFSETQATLTRLGHEYAGRIINYPVEDGGPDRSMEAVANLGENDILLISSRPPMNENPYAAGQVRVSFPSMSEFEEDILFEELRKYLLHCSRKEIALDYRKTERLLPQYRDRAHLEFYVRSQNGGFEAAYQKTSGRIGCEPFVEYQTTVGYLIYTAPLQMPNGRKGPRVLALFGISGTVGVVFANQIWKEKHEVFRGLLEEAMRQPSLSMVEITVKGVPKYYTSLDFADRWDYKLITRRPAQQTGREVREPSLAFEMAIS
jgi:hypothetical protein